MSARLRHLITRRPRGLGGRVLLFVAAFVLASATAAFAYWTVSIIYGTPNYALAQADSLSAPTSPTLTETGAVAITVGWTLPGSQLPGAQYTVTRTSGPGSPFTVCTVSAPTHSCSDSGLTSGTAYGYSVKAVLDNWQSTAITTSATTLGVTTSSLPNGTVGLFYSKSLAATGGSGTYTSWALSSGTLPSWATLNTTTGAITGTPNAATTTSGLQFTVTDSLGFTATSGSLSITVAKDTTHTTISESPTSVAYGNESSVTFTAGVTTTHGEAVPNGDTITVSVNSGAATCTVTLPGTTCTIGNTALAVGGPYAVSATFNGDANLSTSTGTAATGLTVTGPVGLGIALATGSTGTPVIACVGTPSASYTCNVSGVGNAGSVVFYVTFVNSSGTPVVYSTTLASTITETGHNSGTVVIPASASSSASSPSPNSLTASHDGNSQKTSTLTFGSYTLTINVNS